MSSSTSLVSRLRTRLQQARHLNKSLTLACVAAAALAQAPAAQAFTGDWAGTWGHFSFVTYNVAGLPAFLGSTGKDPARTTPEMGRRLLRFDVVNVQEDFNYHAALYSTTGAYSYRTATSGGVPFGSGLNTMSTMTVNGLQRIKWRTCRTDSCLTPKGFTFQRLMVGQGSYVDMYNLHTNANDGDADIAARRDNMVQLAEFMAFWSSGNAVIVAGDTNMRYTRGGENIREFLWRTGLTDTWVEGTQGGVAPAVGPANICPKGQENNDCEVVDKIFYRSGRDIRLWPEGYSNEDRNFLDDDGIPLSDHRPVAAWFGFTENTPKFVMVAQNSGKCANVGGRSSAPGAQVIQWDCQGGIQDGNEKLRQIDDTLRFSHTGMCLDVERGSGGAGARLVQWPCNGQANQNFSRRY